MKAASFFVALSAAAMLCNIATPATSAPADEQERMMLAGGAWPAGKFVPCAPGVVTSVGPRLAATGASAAERFSSGVTVEFRLPAAPKFLNGQAFPTARVVHYDSETGNKLMVSEQPGDRVQVCLVSFPTPTRDLQTGKLICDPNDDPRGMVYRVYDYKRRAAYMGPETEHGCGGA